MPFGTKQLASVLSMTALMTVAGCSAQGDLASRTPAYGVEASAPRTPVPLATVGKTNPTDFVGRYVAMWNYALVSGATDELALMIAPDCRTCWLDVAAMSETSRDHPYRGPLLKVVDVAVHSPGRAPGELRLQAHLQLEGRKPVLVDLSVISWRRSSKIHQQDGVELPHTWRMLRMNRVSDRYYATAAAATFAPSWTPPSSSSGSSSPALSASTPSTSTPSTSRPSTAAASTSTPSVGLTPQAETRQAFPGQWLTIATTLAN